MSSWENTQYTGIGVHIWNLRSSALSLFLMHARQLNIETRARQYFCNLKTRHLLSAVPKLLRHRPRDNFDSYAGLHGPQHATDQQIIENRVPLVNERPILDTGLTLVGCMSPAFRCALDAVERRLLHRRIATHRAHVLSARCPPHRSSISVDAVDREAVLRTA